MVEYRERVRRKYEELYAEKGTVEGERRQYKDAFVWAAEELCGRTSGKGDSGKPRMVDGRSVDGSGGEAGSMGDNKRRRQPGGRCTEHGGVYGRITVLEA